VFCSPAVDFLFFFLLCSLLFSCPRLSLSSAVTQTNAVMQKKKERSYRDTRWARRERRKRASKENRQASKQAGRLGLSLAKSFLIPTEVLHLLPQFFPFLSCRLSDDEGEEGDSFFLQSSPGRLLTRECIFVCGEREGEGGRRGGNWRYVSLVFLLTVVVDSSALSFSSVRPRACLSLYLPCLLVCLPVCLCLSLKKSHIVCRSDTE